MTSKLDILQPRIAATVNDLRSQGLTSRHRILLTKRLKILWGESSGKKSTRWRIKTARQAFSEVQAKSPHLFLVLVLLVTATECGQRAFCDEVITALVKLECYEPYQFSLSADDKDFLERTAKQQGFVEASTFKALMRALIPDGWLSIHYERIN
ncbi:hypothetical protein BCR34DRAFT_253746 [Clohesyomyces aquaticus]|uniref:Uncharacterized protein n=1 Tax=Clohesyomyces aquaticus TaxID=1231657 RepID=A0A1Y1Y3I8_9PLEO|nr:hypothetical protein BCR34DRAFT_253746 [Clohesyomyces aquaticus]